MGELAADQTLGSADPVVRLHFAPENDIMERADDATDTLALQPTAPTDGLPRPADPAGEPPRVAEAAARFARHTGGPGDPALSATGRPDRKQALRLRRLWATTVASLCQVGVLVLCASMGVIDGRTAATGIGTIAALILVFYVVFRTGFNRRFRDPSLTGAQVIAAMVTMQTVYFHASNGRQAFLVAIPIALAFGVYRLRLHGFMRVSAVAMTLHAVQAWWAWHSRPGSIDPLAEVATWVAMATALVTLSIIGGTVTRMWLTSERRKQLAEVTLRSIGDGVISGDGGGHVSFMNPAAETLTGWTFAEARGRPLSEVLRVPPEPADPESASEARARFPDPTGERGPYSGLLIDRSGTEHIIEAKSSRLNHDDGSLFGCVIAFRDVTQTRKLADKIAWDASHDALTGLVNRREFEVVARSLAEDARTSGREHALLYLDLDQFKIVNDTCGHSAGDELLRQIANRLRERLRRGDTFARLGGDEFGILLQDTRLTDAHKVADAIIQSVETFRFASGGRVFKVGTSIGIAAITKVEHDIKSVMAAADAACYLSKEKGGSRFHSADACDEELVNRREEMGWISRLTRCLEEDRFCLYFQRIFPVSGQPGAAIRQELLLRKHTADGRTIAPGAFIPAAERYNMMSRIDQWVIAKAFELLKPSGPYARRPDALAYQFSINLSGASIGDPACLDFILAQRAATGIDPSQVCFEITETAAISNMRDAVRLIESLRDIGFRFALDDFGSGLSSFAYLDELPVDYVKIDGCFVRDMARNPVHRAIVLAIHQVAQAIGVETVAEFVEDAEVLAELKTIGVDYAQGYALHRPEPMPEASVQDEAHWYAVAL